MLGVNPITATSLGATCPPPTISPFFSAIAFSLDFNCLILSKKRKEKKRKRTKEWIRTKKKSPDEREETNRLAFLLSSLFETEAFFKADLFPPRSTLPPLTFPFDLPLKGLFDCFRSIPYLFLFPFLSFFLWRWKNEQFFPGVFAIKTAQMEVQKVITLLWYVKEARKKGNT